MSSTMDSMQIGAFIQFRYKGNTGYGIRLHDGAESITSQYYRSSLTMPIPRGDWVKHVNSQGRWFIAGHNPALMPIPRPIVE